MSHGPCRPARLASANAKGRTTATFSRTSSSAPRRTPSFPLRREVDHCAGYAYPCSQVFLPLRMRQIAGRFFRRAQAEGFQPCPRRLPGRLRPAGTAVLPDDFFLARRVSPLRVRTPDPGARVADQIVLRLHAVQRALAVHRRRKAGRAGQQRRLALRLQHRREAPRAACAFRRQPSPLRQRPQGRLPGRGHRQENRLRRAAPEGGRARLGYQQIPPVRPLPRVQQIEYTYRPSVSGRSGGSCRSSMAIWPFGHCTAHAPDGRPSQRHPPRRRSAAPSRRFPGRTAEPPGTVCRPVPTAAPPLPSRRTGGR